VAKKTTVEVFTTWMAPKTATTVQFSLDGKQYEIDLSEKNEKQLRRLWAVPCGCYSGRPTLCGGGRRKVRHCPGAAQSKHIREWLRGRGRDQRPWPIPTDTCGGMRRLTRAAGTANRLSADTREEALGLGVYGLSRQSHQLLGEGLDGRRKRPTVLPAR